MPAASSSDQWTVRRVLEWTIGHLQRHGSESPRLDAEILLAHSRGCPRIELYTRYDEPLTDEQRRVMRGLVQRRARHEPVAYLVGHREFFSLDFRVTPEVLIPRPDTETLVLEALELVRPLEAPRVLDVGTGSGCLAVSIAVNSPAARVTALDIDAAALEIARRNAEAHGVADRVEFRRGDLFEPLSSGDEFELIVSNPPYVAEGEWDALPPDVREHEPRRALLAGADGLEVIRPLIAGAAEHLAAGGHLLFEIDPAQEPAVGELLAASGVYGDIRFLKDLAGRTRVAAARKVG